MNLKFLSKLVCSPPLLYIVIMNGFYKKIAVMLAFGFNICACCCQKRGGNNGRSNDSRSSGDRKLDEYRFLRELEDQRKRSDEAERQAMIDREEYKRKLYELRKKNLAGITRRYNGEMKNMREKFGAIKEMFNNPSMGMNNMMNVMDMLNM